MPSTATPRAPGWLMWWSGSGPKASRSVAARLSRALRAGIPRTIPGSDCSVTMARSAGGTAPVAPWLHTAEAKDKVAGFLLTAAPLHQWLDQNVGPNPG
jgi:hypothetical protein